LLQTILASRAGEGAEAQVSSPTSNAWGEQALSGSTLKPLVNKEMVSLEGNL
jgi:hypothetical protein